MSVVYGSPPIKSEQDKSVTFITDMASRLGPASAPGAYLVEFMPFLKMIPSRHVDRASLPYDNAIIHVLVSRRFAKWKRQVEEWHAHDSAMFESLFKDVHDRVVRVVPRLHINVYSRTHLV